MKKEILTTEQQQAVAVLKDTFSEIQTSLEWIYQLSSDISTRFFNVSNVQEFISNTSISKSERLIKATKVLREYDTYKIYVGILDHLIFELKEMVDNVC